MSLSQRTYVSETITTALAAVIRGETAGLYAMNSLAAEANFVYGSAGTTVKAWLQTSLDGGDNWIDIANFAFTTTSARKVTALNATTVPAALPTTPTDGTAADDTEIDGILGDRLRVKLTTTGTYAGDTTLDINIVAKS